MSGKDNREFFSDLLKQFENEQNFEQSIMNTMNAVCEKYCFNKVSTFLNERSSEKFLWLHVHTSNEDKTKYTSSHNVDGEVDIRNYPMRMSKQNSKREENLYREFSGSDFLYTKDIQSISEKLEILCLKDTIGINTKELFIYIMKDKEKVSGYCVFEKYDENYISEYDLEHIGMFLNTINIMLIHNETIKELRKKYEMKTALAETIQLENYLAVIEKETFNILYYENSSGHTIEDDVLDRKCYEALFDSNQPCINCPVLYNEIDESVYSKRNNGDYIARVREINWKSEKDAYIISTMDATKAFENKLSHDTLTDSLTWFGFRENIKSTCNPKEKYVYISLNVEGMKLINDIHTQIVGNEILKQISIAIKKFVRKDEYYCRVVADTYAIIIKYVSDDNVAARVKELDGILSNMFKNIFSEIILIITGGICVIEKNLYDNIDIGFENSGLARNSAKGSYKNTFVLYNSSMRDQLKANKYIESKIETAIVNDEFSAYLQPKFELATNKVVGAEALVRWHSSDETIFPDKFIPVFESDGFISTLDFIVYEKIFMFIKECLEENVTVVPISINASRNHLQDDDFFQKLLMLFETYQVPKELIEIEITENASEGSDEDLKEFVKKLKNENISVSMDDFGSAYSSLNLLKTLEIDTLKLDKEFLGKVEKEKFTDLYSKDEIIIKNIVNMANELGFKVLCEGVETKEQVDFLKSIGCDYGQGYVLSKPLPLEEFRNKFL